MMRRSILAAIGVLTGLAGCLGERTKRTDAGGKPTPDPPEDLTAETVLEYVRTYEETRIYNAVVTDDVTDVGIACSVALDRERDGTFYVVSSCRGSYEEETGGVFGFGSTVGLNEVDTPPVTTLVDRDGRRRFDRIGYDVTEPEGDEPRIRLANVHDDEHVITVTVAHEDRPDEPTFVETVALASGDDHVETGVDLGDELDPYELEVAVEGGPSTTYTWDRSEALEGYERVPGDGPISLTDGDDYVVLEPGEHVLPDVGGYVTPDGEVDVATLATEWDG